MKKKLFLAISALAATGMAHADPIDFSKVSAQSNRVMHVDLDALRKSEVGAFLNRKIKQDPNAAKGMNSLKAIFGLDGGGGDRQHQGEPQRATS